MLEIIYCAVAGLLISAQSSFNSRVSEKIGGIETVALAHLVGFIGSVALLLIIGRGDFTKLGEVNKTYITGGLLGVVIVLGITSSVGALGPSLTMGVVVISQLLMGLLIEWVGLFGHDRIQFAYTQPLGIAIMVIGLFILKMK